MSTVYWPYLEAMAHIDPHTGGDNIKWFGMLQLVDSECPGADDCIADHAVAQRIIRCMAAIMNASDVRLSEDMVRAAAMSLHVPARWKAGCRDEVAPIGTAGNCSEIELATGETCHLRVSKPRAPGAEPGSPQLTSIDHPAHGLGGAAQGFRNLANGQ